MTNISSDMIITDSSLSQVSKELIDKRIYKDGTITIVGHPTIVEGTATGFSSSNYFTQSSISFSETLRNAKVTFSGNYSPSAGLNSCAWELRNTENDSLSLTFTQDSAVLYYETQIIAQINNLLFETENPVNISVEFTNSYPEGSEELEQNCSILMFINGKIYTKTVVVPNPVQFNTFNSLVLGNNTSTTKPWQGNIHLADFALYENDSIVYTPSARNTFTFNKIMIGDGVYPLTDTSDTVLNHIYECPITEISRTENNILLTTTIPAGAYLNIAEIALYYTDDTGSHIFSRISGLAVRKNADLSYNLVIHVKLDINVVNTIAMPEIVVKDEDYSNFSKFTTIKQIYAYITVNLERMIRLNALGIGNYTNNEMVMTKAGGVGFNKAQTLYRMENDLALWKDNYLATCNYLKLRKSFSPYTTRLFNSENLQKHGNIILNETTGIARGFYNEGYITTSTYNLSSYNKWTFKTKIRTQSIAGTQAILCLGGDYMNQSLKLYISNGFLKVSLCQEDKIIIRNISTATNYMYLRDGTATINNTEYYKWITTENDTYPVIYTSGFKDFTTATPLYDSTGTVITGWGFSSNVTPNSYTTADLIQLDANSDYDVQLSCLNGLFNLEVVKGAAKQSLDFTFTDAINALRTSYFGVEFNGYATLNPYAGSIDLLNTSLTVSTVSESAQENSEYTYEFVTTAYFKNNLLDYFHIPDYAFHYFRVDNLGYDGVSYLEEYDGSFEGNLDRVDFLIPEGFTLCTKVHLIDPEDKILVAKGNNATGEVYFKLEVKNQELVFSLFLDSATVVMKKDFSSLELLRKYIEDPMTITVTCDGNQYSPLFKMYRNNELLSQYLLPNMSTRNIFNMYLTNFSEDTLGKHELHDIISLSGQLSPSEIYYINNILDTNF